MKPILVTDLRNVGLKDVASVGGKNASLGELFNCLEGEGVRLPGGFATTVDAYWRFLNQGRLKEELIEFLTELNPKYVPSIERVAQRARAAILAHELPEDLKREISNHFDLLCTQCGREPSLAVRSSATAEDLPGVSFAGQHATFLNVCGKDELITAVHHCYASLFMARAIDYRIRNGFDHMRVALSVGVQQMVRSDLGSSGVIYTLDTESGFRDVVLVSGSYGLGETIVQGQVIPDEWTVFKPTLNEGFEAIIDRRLGTKEIKLIFEANSGGTRLADVEPALRTQFCLTDTDVVQLARWACAIETHYSKEAGHLQPMDIEWAKDGDTGEMFILQARPLSANEVGEPAHVRFLELSSVDEAAPMHQENHERKKAHV